MAYDGGIPSRENDPLSPQAADQVKVDYIAGLVDESLASRRKYQDGYQMDRNLRFYLGDQLDYVPSEDLEVFVINKVQNAMIAATAVQSEMEAVIKLKPRETNDPQIGFLREEVGQALHEQVQRGQIELPEEVELTERQLKGFDYIDDETVKDLLSIPRMEIVQDENGEPAVDDEGNVQMQPAIDPETGQPETLLTEDDFHLINDDTVAKYEETVLQTKWDQADGQRFLNENILDNNVLGIQPWLTQYDDQYHCFEFENPSPKRVYLDPGNTVHRRQAFVIYDELKAESEMIFKYPHLERQIREHAERGAIHSWTHTDADWGEYDTDVEHQQRMVIVRTAWLRYTRYPAEVEEALRYGWVKEGKQDPRTGEYAPGRYYIPSDEDESTGEPTEPGQSNWPKIFATRQVQIVADQVVDDRRCPYREIPMTWNRCKPIPGKPWGLGMPELLEPIQRAINMLASIFFNHAAYYQSPMEVMPQAVYDLLQGDEAAEVGSFPGRQVIVPDAWYKEFQGEAVHFKDPPTLPQSLYSFWEYLMGLFDQMSGNSNVMRGESDPDASSGKAIQALQEAARSLFGFLSQQTEDMLRDVATVMLYTMRDLMPEHEWMAASNRYPIQVLRAIQQRAKRLHYDVQVEIAAASGANRQQEQAQAREDYQLGLLSQETTMEKIGVANVQSEQRRLHNEQQKVEQQAATDAMAQQPPQ